MEDNQPQNRPKKRSLRFTAAMWLGLSVIALCWILFYLALGHYSEVDKLAYEKMISGDGIESKQPGTQVSKQIRTGMQKSVYFIGNHQRLELRITSATSELAFEKNDRHVQIVEHLHDVAGWLQERLYYVLPDGREADLQGDGRLLIKGADPQDQASWISIDDPRIAPEQSLIIIKADNATYHYANEQFIAENVTLWRYIAAAHHLEVNVQESKLIAHALASDMELSLSGKGMDFFADNFNAKFSMPSRAQVRALAEIGVAADHIDYNGGQVTLTGHASVGYEQLSIAADMIVLQLSKNEASGIRSDSTIEKITANGNVVMNYNGNVATSDEAIFKRNHEASSKEILPGIVTLRCTSADRLCRVTNPEGDEIQSTMIKVDTTRHELMFTYPKGTVSSLEFSADRLVWNDLDSKLTLSGGVQLAQQGFGKLQTANDVRLLMTVVGGKKVLRGMETTGEATLTYVDKDTGLDHVLKSYGSLRIDHLKMETKLQSPENADGSVNEGQQVFYKDSKGELHANKVFVKYDYVDKKIVPVRIVLQGDVKITNNLERSEKDKTISSQYILADRVDFIPQTKLMIFKADKGQRVLLFDKGNNLEVSAPGLKIVRDIATRKETIQGIGDVRFSFVENEFERIRHRFTFDKMAQDQGRESV
ncbi:MAG TPA: hypothetical protein VGP47_01255, partial [Parachlamydiaceae bacterium]|nr:hypothetical protein [Parachlamydiaceae bacterium]